MTHSPEEIDIVAEIVNARSDALIAEFKLHVAAWQRECPDIDAEGVFSGWVLQKIAGLQILTEELAKTTEALRDRMTNESSCG